MGQLPLHPFASNADSHGREQRLQLRQWYDDSGGARPVRFRRSGLCRHREVPRPLRASQQHTGLPAPLHVNLPSSLVELKPTEEGEPLLEKEPGDLTVTESPALWYTHWNSMEPIAPRPLSIRKNVTELYKTDGRWINRDPIREKGGLNLYRFISNNPIYSFDYVGINRYITHFDIAGFGGSGKTNIHVGIAVDKWIEKNGIVTYVFAALLTENSGFWSTTGNILNLLASIIIAKGKIISISGLHLESPIIMQSSPCQDIEMLSKLVEDDASPPGYNVISNSCIIWSSNAALYGMDKPSIEKCFNPDKTLFKAED